MTYSTHEGYRDAAKIDKILNQVLQEHNASEVDNRPGYHVLIRTIHSSLNIIRPKVGLRLTASHMTTVIPE